MIATGTMYNILLQFLKYYDSQRPQNVSSILKRLCRGYKNKWFCFFLTHFKNEFLVTKRLLPSDNKWYLQTTSSVGGTIILDTTRKEKVPIKLTKYFSIV